ncbi:MAG TPA: erythromycin esterase family protein [Thermoanaerobaculia bacterium]
MTTRRLLFLLAVVTILLADPLSASSRRRAVRHPDPTPITPEEWLQTYAIPFATTEARSGLADLAPLRTLVGDARIVSLGEATHGSREMFTMKHRILEYLVEEMGFTVFAIEANLPEADRVDNYVLHGIGDPGAALTGMYFWTWDTDEVLDMIHWMREYNLRRGDKPPVRFRGFDAQFAHYAVPQVEAYIARIDASSSPFFGARYACIRGKKPSDYRVLSAQMRNACVASLVEARNALEQRRADYTARSSAEEFERHLRYADVVVQAENIWSNRGSRDRFMAQNVEYFADVAHPGEKIVLWAHNRHVATDAPYWQGSWLRLRFGDDMVIFGFVFDRGGFTAIGLSGLGPQRVESFPNGWDAFFRKAARPLFFLDLRNPPSEAVDRFLKTPNTTWAIGSTWYADYAEMRWEVALQRAFDVIIYIEETTASRLR